MNLYKKDGFSLVELSIVILVIGLIVGGIMSGTHLLQASRINNVIKELQSYSEVILKFKDKYHAWPGDMPDATSHWGVYHATTNVRGTVNGDGDGDIEGDFTERLRAWQHISLAGMVKGYYSGAGASYSIDVNVPPSVLDSGAYFFGTSSAIFNAREGARLRLSSYNGATSAAVLRPAEALLVDKKIDDGTPDDGEIFILRGGIMHLLLIDVLARDMTSLTLACFYLMIECLACCSCGWSRGASLLLRPLHNVDVGGIYREKRYKMRSLLDINECFYVIFDA